MKLQPVSLHATGHKTYKKNPYYCEDPNGIRDGNGVGETLMATFQKVAEDTKIYISSDQVKARVCMDIEILNENNIDHQKSWEAAPNSSIPPTC